MTTVVHVQKSAGIGGSERHLLALLPALANEGLNTLVIVLTAPGADAFTSQLSAAGVEVMTIPAGPDLNPAVLLRLWRWFRRHRPDLVHTHLVHADLHALAAARITRIPGVSSVHGAHASHRGQPYRSAARAAGRMACRTIAISHYIARTLTEARIVPEDRVRVVHYGVDAKGWASTSAERDTARHAVGLAREDVAVAIVGRLIPGKGHGALVRAVAECRRRGTPLRLLIAGEGDARPRIEALVRAEGIAGAVSFLGFVTDVSRVMSASDIVAFPTESRLGEGFGLAALEAMAARRPVVATRIASLPEVIADGQTGLLVNSGDAAALASALERLSFEPGLRSKLGDAGQARGREHFSLDRMVDATIAVYEQLLAKKESSLSSKHW